MPPLPRYFIPKNWTALAYLQVNENDPWLFVYHDGAQRRLWGDNQNWLSQRIAAGDYRQVDIPPKLKGAQR